MLRPGPWGYGQRALPRLSDCLDFLVAQEIQRSGCQPEVLLAHFIDRNLCLRNKVAHESHKPGTPKTLSSVSPILRRGGGAGVQVYSCRSSSENPGRVGEDSLQSCGVGTFMEIGSPVPPTSLLPGC